MVKEVPFIAHMIIIRETDNEEINEQTDKTYYNSDLDSESEYCMNTTAWD